jgi:IS5 family transposase
MNKQKPFTSMEYAQRKRTGRREKFSGAPDAVIHRAAFEETVKPFYPKSGRRGRPPKGIELMLRMYFLQVWYNLADEALEENIYDIYSMRKFMKLDYFKEDVPDATTLPQFRHMLEKHNLQKELFETQKELMDAEGIMMHGGTIADAGTGIVHSVEATGANVHDLDAASKLIRSDNEVVNGDAGYAGIEEREEIKNDGHLSKIDYRINKRKGADKKRHDKLLGNPMKHLDYIAQTARDKHIEYMKSNVRCKVEHAFAIIKNKFGCRKAVCRGLEKNKARLYMLFCSANLLRLSWPLA